MGYNNRNSFRIFLEYLYYMVLGIYLQKVSIECYTSLIPYLFANKSNNNSNNTR